MRVAIIGSRSIVLKQERDILAYLPEQTTEIISGGAEGADQLAERVASFLRIPITVFRPDYARYHRRAPLERNLDIIRRADHVIALWDGHSRGTAHVIDHCIKEYKPIQVLLCRDGEFVQSILK